MDKITDFAFTKTGQVTMCLIGIIVLVLYILLIIWETKNVD